LGDAADPFAGAVDVFNPAAFHGVFQGLREVESADGQGGADQMQQAQQGGGIGAHAGVSGNQMLVA